MNAIVAIEQNNGIGKDNKLPWHIKGELNLFRTLTQNSTLYCGRKTAQDLPHINRKVTIISNTKLEKKDFNNPFHQISRAQFSSSASKLDGFLIGGAQIYNAHMHLCKNLYLSLNLKNLKPLNILLI